MRKHTDGRPRKWQVEWSVTETDRDGSERRKFFSQSFRTEEQALAFKREKEDQTANASPLLDPRKGKQTLRHWADEWWRDWEPTVKSYTAKKSRGLLDSSILPALGARPIRRIDTSDVQKLINGLSEPDPITGRKRKPNTVRHHYLVLKAVLEYAAQHKAIATAPTQGIKLPTNKRMGTQPRRPRFLTADEVEKLAAAFSTATEDYTPEPNSPYPLMIRFMAWTGLRVGEVAGLNIGDVDFDKGTVLVERTRRKVKGGWEIETTKTGNWREVPIDAIHTDLDEYVHNHPHGDDLLAPLWPGRSIASRSKHGNGSCIDWDKPFDPGVFYQRHFQPALKRAGLPADVRQHDLRHSFASLCSSLRVPVEQVAEWMGHKDVTVTQTIYTHLFKHDSAEHGRTLGKAAARARSEKSDNVIRLAR